MPDLVNSVASADFVTALDATPGNNDTITLRDSAREYTSSTDISAADLNQFDILASSRNNFDSSPLNVVVSGVSNAEFNNWGSGDILRITCGGTADVIDVLNNKPTNSAMRTILSALTVTELNTNAGLCIVNGSCDVNLVRTSGVADTVIEYDGTNTIANECTFNGKRNVLKRDLPSFTLGAAALLVLEHTAVAPASGAEIHGTMRVRASGTFGGTVNLHRGAVLDLTEMDQAALATGTIVLHDGSEVRYRKGQDFSSIITGTVTDLGTRKVAV